VVLERDQRGDDLGRAGRRDVAVGVLLEQDRARVAVDDGLLDVDGDRFVLTDRGRLLADAVVRTVLD